MKRPFGVTVIGVLLFLQGAYLALAVGFGLILGLILERNLLFGVLPPVLIDALRQSGVSNLWSIGLNAAIAIGAVTTGIAMLRLRPWAWLVAMTLQGITLASEIISYFHGLPNYLNMVIGATIVFYLNTRTVREAFERSWRAAAGSAGEHAAGAGAQPRSMYL